MGRVVHFEIFTGDTSGSIEFYRKVLDWDVEAWEGPFEYHLVTTGAEGEPGINGAISPFGVAEEQRVVLTVGVADIDAAIGRAITSGATLIGEKNEIPGVGIQAYLKDPTGTVFSVLQPTSAPMGGEDAAGRDVWSEFGESLRQLGETVSGAFSEAASSAQAQRARDEAERAAKGIRDASAVAADKARPHVISALDRVSVELGNLASRLRREEAGGPTAEESAATAAQPGPTGTGPAEGTATEAPPDEI